jgi:PST family polysaccharide transporter
VTLIGGPQYPDAAPVFRVLVPVLFFSFPGMLLGWPALGPIGKQKETTMTTIIASVFQVLGLIVLIVLGRFSLIHIAILRDATEALLMLLRAYMCYKFRRDFAL